MPLDRTIDVIVSHSLPRDKAFDRVVDWLASQRDGAKAIKTIIDNENYTITSVSETHGKRITLNINVTDSVVELHSDPIDGKWIEMVFIAGSVRYNESRLFSQLTEALK